MWIDTHCHLTYEGLIENQAAVLARAATAEVGRCITIGTHLEDHNKVLTTLRKFPTVFGALGIHPHHAAEIDPGWEGFVEHRFKTEPKLLAVGECGLDYHYDNSPKLIQKGVFTTQLEMARRLNLPAILHVRDAHADALAIIQSFPEVRIVVHCFTGTPAECKAWIDLGAYIGITGIVTYKNAPDVREDAKLVPADRLLVETDAPYLSPDPVRSTKPCEPAFVKHTGEFVAQLRGVSPAELAKQTTENAARLFGSKLIA
jgi:TatD DNase family protein